MSSLRQYQMILGDDDEAEYISSEDDDYAPPVPKARNQKPSPRKKKKEVVKSTKREKDEELEGLLGTSTFYAEVKENVDKSDEFESAINKLDVYIDIESHQTSVIQLPDRKQFWIYVSG